VAGDYISEEELKKRVEYLERMLTKQNPTYPKYTTIRIRGDTLEMIDGIRINPKESNDNVLKRVLDKWYDCIEKEMEVESKT
jgi:hypothetical protein